MLVGILEEIEDLLQLEFGLVNAGDVPEADPVLGHLLDLLADRGLGAVRRMFAAGFSSSWSCVAGSGGTG